MKIRGRSEAGRRADGTGAEEAGRRRTDRSSGVKQIP